MIISKFMKKALIFILAFVLLSFVQVGHNKNGKLRESLIKKEELITSLYQKGDELKVKVIYINNQQGKIALSAKI